MFPLSKLLAKVIRNGKLEVLDHAGQTHTFGASDDGSAVRMHIKNKTVYWSVLSNPELKLAEAYMDGDIDFLDGSSVFDFLSLFFANRRHYDQSRFQKSFRAVSVALRRFQQNNTILKSLKVAKEHYDLSTDMYRLFLDEDMQYTCAYFTDPNKSLEQAQQDKLALVGRKLNLKPGMRVAELGCGWGGLALYLARTYDVHVTAVNISTEQLAIARQRAKDEGLSDRIDFLEQDYRALEGQFDRVVSIGMLEHVGIKYHDVMLRKVRDLMKEDGSALLHFISKTTPPGATSPFLHKHIFPGGYSPALSEVFSALEYTGLWATDVECLRLHYHYTIEHWRTRFDANRDAAKEIFDERFCRMWEFYLSAVSLVFLYGTNFVAQIQLAKQRDAVPITRDYLFPLPGQEV